MNSLTETVVAKVGKFYRVPTVRGRLYSTIRNWPVMGPKHEDGEFINFPYQHYHIDWRFVPEADFRRVGYSHYGIPLCESARINENGLGAPTVRLRKCQREWWPYPRVAASWLKKLEPAFAGCKLKNMICPHRGISLVGAPQEGDVVTCPGHGLRWNVKTGELVT